ncbi:MAG: NAD+ synthase [Chloroflexota bacterium]|nr:NAD+ synthase [Chloroflexota bacterium]MDP6758380.1 NAD+ synthase [Chloroflexota bacterium]
MSAFDQAGSMVTERLADELSVDVDSVIAQMERFVHHEIKEAGFDKAVVALSGGIDSAVVATVAALAVGSENVVAVMLPYKASSPGSRDDARDLIGRLGLESLEIDITPMVDSFASMRPAAGALRMGNVMARCRMIVAYDVSAEAGGLVVGTSNRTETLLGYGTLFGDAAWAINPIGDLYKTQLRQVAAELDIPDAILTKPPSADLWVGQTDEEELGISYADADMILYLLHDEERSPAEVKEMGVESGAVDGIVARVAANAFKSRPARVAELES